MPRRRAAEPIRRQLRVAGRAVATLVAAPSFVFAVGLPTVSPAASGEARFEQVFASDGEPGSVHFKAVYGADAGADARADARRGAGAGAVDARNVHRLEVWRDHEIRIRRKTDDRIDIVATRLEGEGEGEGEGGIRFSVVDLLRGTTTVIDRVELMRLGLFVDWFSQGHALLRPTGGYRLVGLDRPAVDPLASHGCAWWRLEPQLVGESTTDICWSDELKLPLLMQDRNHRIVWRVVTVEKGPIDDAAFMAATKAIGGAGTRSAPEEDAD